MLLFFTIIFQGGIILHYLVKDRIVSVLKISEHISIIILYRLSLIHISEPTRREWLSRMPSSA